MNYNEGQKTKQQPKSIFGLVVATLLVLSLFSVAEAHAQTASSSSGFKFSFNPFAKKPTTTPVAPVKTDTATTGKNTGSGLKLNLNPFAKATPATPAVPATKTTSAIPAIPATPAKTSVSTNTLPVV